MKQLTPFVSGIGSAVLLSVAVALSPTTGYAQQLDEIVEDRGFSSDPVVVDRIDHDVHVVRAESLGRCTAEERCDKECRHHAIDCSFCVGHQRLQLPVMSSRF